MQQAWKAEAPSLKASSSLASPPPLPPLSPLAHPVTFQAVLWQRLHQEQVCFWEQGCVGWWRGSSGGETLLLETGEGAGVECELLLSEACKTHRVSVRVALAEPGVGAAGVLF